MNPKYCFEAEEVLKKVGDSLGDAQREAVKWCVAYNGPAPHPASLWLRYRGLGKKAVEILRGKGLVKGEPEKVWKEPDPEPGLTFWHWFFRVEAPLHPSPQAALEWVQKRQNYRKCLKRCIGLFLRDTGLDGALDALDKGKLPPKKMLGRMSLYIEREKYWVPSRVEMEDPLFAGLSGRTKKFLLRRGILSKEIAVQALKMGCLVPLKTHEYGLKTHKEVLDWIGENVERRRGPLAKPELCPFCENHHN